MDTSVAVLIPTKNRRVLLEKALKSVFLQISKPNEIIVVNDGSTDDTKTFLDSLIGKYDNLKIIQREKSGGVNTARNQGIKISKSEWIMFLDDDDEFLPNAVLLARQKVKEIPNDFYLFAFNTHIKTDKEEFAGGLQFKEGEYFYDPIYEDVMVKSRLRGDCKAVFRKSLFDSEEYLFPEIVNGFESFIIRKMAKDNKKLRYYNEVSTVMNLQTNFEHLSSSAPAKNPEIFLQLNVKDLKYHQDFYNSNLDILRRKYIEIAKLALRSHQLNLLLYYGVISLMTYIYPIPKYILRYFGMQRWIRLGLRYKVILNLPKQNYNFAVPFFNYIYKGNLKDYIDKYVFYFGAYEREELLYIKKYLSQDSIVLDVGANTGHHSLFFSKFAKKVYAFEPYNKPFETLLKRIEDNKIINVFPFNFGLGNKVNQLDFFAPAGQNGGIGSFVSSPDKVNIGKLDINNGDDFVEDLKEEKIDFIKVDVEGMEIDVLDGLKRTIKKFKPVIFVEMSPESQIKLLKDLKEIVSAYDINIIDANSPLLVFFNKPGCKIEKFEPTIEMKNLLFVPKI